MCEPKTTLQRLICMAQDERAVEFQNALIALLMAVWWISPFWNVYESCPQVYQFMYWLPRQAWALAFGAVASFHLWALWQGHKWWRKHILLIKGALWLNLAITVAYGDYTAPSCAIFFLLAANTFRGFLCLRVKK